MEIRKIYVRQIHEYMGRYQTIEVDDDEICTAVEEYLERQSGIRYNILDIDDDDRWNTTISFRAQRSHREGLLYTYIAGLKWYKRNQFDKAVAILRAKYKNGEISKLILEPNF